MKVFEYYKYIYENFLCRYRTEFNDATYCFLQKNKSVPDEILILAEQIKSQFGISMFNLISVNYTQFTIWRKSMNFPEFTQAVDASTYFVMFCCLADKILDSSHFSYNLKKIICERLDIKLMLKNKVDFKQTIYLGAFDELFMRFCGLFRKIYSEKSCFRNLIIKKINEAFISERYMFENPLKEYDSIDSIHHLTGKSIEFESASFLIASADNKNNIMEIINIISKIFWLADDICDMPEDIKNRQKNSLIFMNKPENTEICLNEINLREILDNAVSLLEYYISELKNMVDSEFYYLIMFQIYEWFKPTMILIKEKK